MKHFFRKTALIILSSIFALVFGVIAVSAQFYNDDSSPFYGEGLFKILSGSIVPNDSTLGMGTSTQPIVDGHFTSLHAGTLYLTGSQLGNLNVYGYVSSTEGFRTNGYVSSSDLTFTSGTGTNLYVSSKLKTDSIQSISGGIGLLAAGDVFPTINLENNGSVKLFEGAESPSSAELYIIGKTKFAETAYPDADNAYDFGSTANSWKNGYFDGTIYGNYLNSSAAYVETYKTYNFTSNLNFALRQNTANYVFQDASSSALMTLFGYGTLATRNHMPSANNTYSLGSPATSWANLYTSGTIYSVNQINTGTVTSTNMSVGSMVLEPDSGVVPLVRAPATSLSTSSTIGYYFGLGGNLSGGGDINVFSPLCAFDGTSCTSSSTRLSINVPLAFPSSVTTTIATSTMLGADAVGYKGRFDIVGSNVGTTVVNQIFATSTPTIPHLYNALDGMEICLHGLSDTSTVTIDNSAYIKTNGAVSRVIGRGDILCFAFNTKLNFWSETRFSDITP